METERTRITVETIVNAPVEKAWEYRTKPEHITQWAFASDEWHAPFAEQDLRAGGKFVTRMEAKDGSMGFDFGGVYDEVVPNEYYAYTMGDGRQASTKLIRQGNATKIEESFDAEGTNPVELQRAGWQAILDNFKKYAESQ